MPAFRQRFAGSTAAFARLTGENLPVFRHIRRVLGGPNRV